MDITYFTSRAANYDELRPGPSDEHMSELVAFGDLAKQRIVDVGCGTGASAAILAEYFECEVTGLEPSDLRIQALQRCQGRFRTVVDARAESMPFANETFDRVLLRLVLHLVERPSCLAECARVLRPSGMLVSVVPDPQRLEELWMCRYFSSYAATDRARLSTPSSLAAEFSKAGLSHVRWLETVEVQEYSRQRALALLKARFTTTLALLGEKEFDEGLARAHRELPDTIVSRIPLLIGVASRSCEKSLS